MFRNEIEHLKKENEEIKQKLNEIYLEQKIIQINEKSDQEVND
jgi:hypothetical protein